MIGLAYVFVFVVYLLISVEVVKYFARLARKRGIAGWKWGAPVAMVMYLIVFWDYIPTEIAHKYYCYKEGGLRIHKTLEQWKKENPGFAETLTYKEISDSEGNKDKRIYHLNERFDWVINRDTVFLTVKRRHNKIIDIKNNEIIAEYTDFKSGHGSPMTGYGGWGKAKMWLNNDSCDKNVKSRKRFYKYEASIEKLGEDL